MNSSLVSEISDGRPARRRAGREQARSNRPLLAMTTRSVTSRSTGLAGLRNEPHAHDPLAPSCLVPDDLAPQQQAEAVLQDGDDVGGQRPVRLAAQVGHVDGDAAAGLERAHALGEDRRSSISR